MRKTPDPIGAGTTFASQLPAALLNAFDPNDRINQYYRQYRPGGMEGEGPGRQGPHYFRHCRSHAQRARHVAEGFRQRQRYP